MSAGGEWAGAPAQFDDALFAADLARLPESARAAIDAARRRYEREGVGPAERRRCDSEHASGTRLPGCVKVYVPDVTGPWRIVFQVAWLGEDELGLQYVAAGVAHPPRNARPRSVYEFAHYRLHGRWPQR